MSFFAGLWLVLYVLHKDCSLVLCIIAPSMHTCFYLLQAVSAPLGRQSIWHCGLAFTARGKESCASPVPFCWSCALLFVKNQCFSNWLPQLWAFPAQHSFEMSFGLGWWLRQKCVFANSQFILYFKKLHRRGCHCLWEETSEEWLLTVISWLSHTSKKRVLTSIK